MALRQRVARRVLELFDQVQFKFGTLLGFAPAVLLNEVVVGHIHCLDQDILIRPDALPEESVGHGLARKFCDSFQECERLAPRRRPLRLLRRVEGHG
ncbi:hypothetical protein D3C78_1454530 [compost metagenome]